MITKFKFWYEREDFYPDENFMCDVYKIEYIADNKIELNDAYIFNPYTNVAEDFYAKAKIYLMKSTGFKDCEGKEIYEGDILIETKSKDTFEVKYGWFEDVSVSIFLQMGVYLYDGYETRPFYRLNYKVIGNIYENPELLEVSE